MRKILGVPLTTLLHVVWHKSKLFRPCDLYHVYGPLLVERANKMPHCALWDLINSDK